MKKDHWRKHKIVTTLKTIKKKLKIIMKIIKKGCKSECEINSLMKKRLWRENMGEIETGRCWKKKKKFYFRYYMKDE